MGWKFRKRVKIIPGVRLNISGSGISTTVGPRGVNVNVGKKGAHLNTGIPGTGIYDRHKLTPGASKRQHSAEPEPVPEPGLTPTAPPPQPQPQIEPGTEIRSDTNEAITSPGLESLKTTALDVHERRRDLETESRQLHVVASRAHVTARRARWNPINLFRRDRLAQLDQEAQDRRQAADECDEELQECFLELSVELDGEIAEKHRELVDAFDKASSSHSIWDVTSAKAIDVVAERSSASSAITRQRVSFGVRESRIIRSQNAVLHLQNANGGDLYLYSGFLVVAKAEQDFALVDLRDVELTYSTTRFVETEQVPGDSEVVDHTWRYVNKSGKPDRRYKDNYEIPVAVYGSITLRTDAGLHEEYMLSHAANAEQFADAFHAYAGSLPPTPEAS